MADTLRSGGTGGAVQVVNGTTTVIKDSAIFSHVREAGSAAIAVGYGLCYNGTTDVNQSQVAVPSVTNNTRFAGVLYRDAIPASHALNNQYVIAKPGSIVDIYVDGTVTAGQIVTALVGTGAFSATYNAGWGRGSARCLAARTGAGLVSAELLDGAETGLVQTISAAGATTIIKHGVLVVPTQTIASDITASIGAVPFAGARLHVIVGVLTTSDFILTVPALTQSLTVSAAADDTAVGQVLAPLTITVQNAGTACWYSLVAIGPAVWKLTDVSPNSVSPAA